MDAVSNPLVEIVTVMSAAQIGKTDILNNVIGYHIHQDAAPILYVHPTLEMAQAWSKDRFAPMLRDTPVLNVRVSDVKTKVSSNTILHKQFDGGHITASGANSPASLASRPVRIVLCDEVDRFPPTAGTEGDPVSLAEKRSTTFWNRKRIRTSTPTVAGVSRIEASWNESNQSHFLIPCPFCAFEQKLMFNPRAGWEHVPMALMKFDKANLKATLGFECCHCKKRISEHQKVGMIRRGRWRATFPDRKWHAGFHLNEFVSPWSNWLTIVEGFLVAKQHPERLRVWVNTTLGEVWEEEESFTIDVGQLEVRVEPYEAAPAGVLVITAGVDIQENRIECVICGWGLDEECWVLDRKVFYGHPQRGRDIWKLVASYLQTQFKHEAGTMRCTSGFVDSGFAAGTVYEFTKPLQRRMIYSAKGYAGNRPLIGKPSKNNKLRAMVFPIGVDEIKGKLYDRLQIDEAGAGFIHFKAGVCDEDFMLQLTSEKHVLRHHRGFPSRVWVLKEGRRNEVLDCMVYAYAAFKMLNLNLQPAHDAMQKRMAAVAKHEAVAERGEGKPRDRRVRTRGKYWSEFG